MDVTEVGLGADAGAMVQRDERLPAVGPPLAEAAAVLIITVFGDEAAVDLGGGVALLARRHIIGAEDRVHERAERTKYWGRARRRRPCDKASTLAVKPPGTSGGLERPPITGYGRESVADRSWRCLRYSPGLTPSSRRKISYRR